MQQPQSEMKELETILDKLNRMTAKLGLPAMQIVNPGDCIPQDKNARYFKPEIFQQLVKNVKTDQRLESTPLVYQDPKKQGKYRIISGHHRIEAAKQAAIKHFFVLVIEPGNKDEIISKQLSHNSLVGQDDKVILNQLFQEIKNLEKKIASGITNDPGKIDYIKLNFTPQNFKQVILLFLPEDHEKIAETLEQLNTADALPLDKNGEIWLASAKIFDKFATQLQTIKKNENIKNNATAVMRMVEIVEHHLQKEKDQTNAP